jgi:glycosyltransferase involved in cell wall biosynthesis
METNRPIEFLGLMYVKNEGRLIRKVLAAQFFCEKIIVLDNHSTDNTREVCREFQNVVVVESPYPPSFNEGRDREFLAFVAKQYHPSWIVSLSGDEVLEPDTWKKLQPLYRNPDVKCIRVHSLNFWDNENTLRVDGHWRAGFRQSFWRFIPGNLTYQFAHCSLPDQLDGVIQSNANIALWHYGYMERTRRRNTVSIYEAMDPEGKFAGKAGYRAAIQGDFDGPDPRLNLTGEPFKLQSVDEFLQETGNIYSRLVE